MNTLWKAMWDPTEANRFELCLGAFLYSMGFGMSFISVYENLINGFPVLVLFFIIVSITNAGGAYTRFVLLYRE